MNKEKYKAELERKKRRLELYESQEEKMLSGGVQSYGLGSRNVAKYNTDLAQVRAAIKELEAEIEELEGLISGKKSRRCMGVVPRF